MIWIQYREDGVRKWMTFSPEKLESEDIKYQECVNNIDWIGNLAEFKDKSPGSTGLSHLDTYEYLGEIGIKDSSKNWISGALYRSCESGSVYARDLEDFKRKFNIRHS